MGGVGFTESVAPVQRQSVDVNVNVNVKTERTAISPSMKRQALDKLKVRCGLNDEEMSALGFIED